MTPLPPRAADARLETPAAVLIDLDGTLLDLPVDIEPARAEVERLLGAVGHTGRAAPILAAIAAAADRAGQGGPALRRAAYDVLDRAELAAAPRAIGRPGAAALLAALAVRRIPVAIVTDNGRACVGPALVAAGLPAPAALIARDDVNRSKPSPDGVLAALDALGSPVGPCWWIGDASRDVVAGILARESRPGMPLAVVGVGDRGGASELVRAGADRVVVDLAELAALVG